jgi:hypothetical protein
MMLKPALSAEVTFDPISWFSEHFSRCVIGLIAVWAVFVLEPRLVAQTADYHITGELTITGFDSRGEPTQIRKRLITVDVKACRWRIVIHPQGSSVRNDFFGKLSAAPNGEKGQQSHFPPPATNNNMTLTEDAEHEIIYAYDGATMYRLGDIKEAFRVKNSANDGMAALAFGAFPESRDLSGVQPVWLAYASVCSFDDNRQGETRIISSTPVVAPYAITPTWLKTEWKWTESSNFLESVRYYTDKAWSALEIKPAPVPFNKGYVLAEFNSCAMSNINGTVIPSGFDFDEFALVPLNRSRTNSSFKRIKVSTASFRVSSAESPSLITDFIPLITNRVYVDDHRFLTSGVNSVTYLVSTHEWLPVSNKTVLQALYVAQRATEPRPMPLKGQNALGSHIVVIRVLLASFLLLPLIYLLFRLMKNASKTNKPKPQT